jgi:hypothetical protein
VYFVVVLTLLFGEELDQALREEDERSRNVSRDDSLIGSETENEEHDDELSEDEFHDAKAIQVLGADM